MGKQTKNKPPKGPVDTYTMVSSGQAPLYLVFWGGALLVTFFFSFIGQMIQMAFPPLGIPLVLGVSGAYIYFVWINSHNTKHRIWSFAAKIAIVLHGLFVLSTAFSTLRTLLHEVARYV